MRKVSFAMAVFLAAVLCGKSALAQQPQDSAKEKSHAEAMKDCPIHQQRAAKSKDSASSHTHQGGSGATLEERGNAGMGFEQSKTTHHFLLKSDGGAIEVQANDAEDAASVKQIRAHLQHIAASFGGGDFQIPMLVHDDIPPGTTAMKRLREKIQYSYEEAPTGARVVIKTGDASALDAIHDFLRYQIREHETGDPQTVGLGGAK